MACFPRYIALKSNDWLWNNLSLYQARQLKSGRVPTDRKLRVVLETFWHGSLYHIARVFRMDFLVSPVPSGLLENMCKRLGLDSPEYTYLSREVCGTMKDWHVRCVLRVGNIVISEGGFSGQKKLSEAYAALGVLIAIARNMPEFRLELKRLKMQEWTAVNTDPIDGEKTVVMLTNETPTVKANSVEKMLPGVTVVTHKELVSRYPTVRGKHDGFVRINMEIASMMIKELMFDLVVVMTREKAVVKRDSQQGKYKLCGAVNLLNLKWIVDLMRRNSSQRVIEF